MVLGSSSGIPSKLRHARSPVGQRRDLVDHACDRRCDVGDDGSPAVLVRMDSSYKTRGYICLIQGLDEGVKVY